jgi:hypothetical protein
MRMLELQRSSASRSVRERILEKTDVLVNEDVDERLSRAWGRSSWINKVGRGREEGLIGENGRKEFRLWSK